MYFCIGCCLLRRMSSETQEVRHSSVRQAIRPARIDEKRPTNRNAATGERGYHNNIALHQVVFG